jgi:prepilin-type N-terminal cleavage/methylation domain-containing protein
MRYTTTKSQQGFTLVEMLVTLVIISMLVALSTINLSRPQTTVSLDGAVDALIADLKNQQLLAMSGDQGGTAAQQAQGIFMQSGSYTLFAGATYNVADANNFVVSTGQGITMATTFPSTRVVFNKGSGDVSGFVNGSNTITLSSSGQTKILTLSRLGAIAVN